MAFSLKLGYILQYVERVSLLFHDCKTKSLHIFIA